VVVYQSGLQEPKHEVEVERPSSLFDSSLSERRNASPIESNGCESVNESVSLNRALNLTQSHYSIVYY
jgi:hypothetical protein